MFEIITTKLKLEQKLLREGQNDMLSLLYIYKSVNNEWINVGTIELSNMKVYTIKQDMTQVASTDLVKVLKLDQKILNISLKGYNMYIISHENSTETKLVKVLQPLISRLEPENHGTKIRINGNALKMDWYNSKDMLTDKFLNIFVNQSIVFHILSKFKNVLNIPYLTTEDKLSQVQGVNDVQRVNLLQTSQSHEVVLKWSDWNTFYTGLNRPTINYSTTWNTQLCQISIDTKKNVLETTNAKTWIKEDTSMSSVTKNTQVLVDNKGGQLESLITYYLAHVSNSLNYWQGTQRGNNVFLLKSGLNKVDVGITDQEIGPLRNELGEIITTGSIQEITTTKPESELKRVIARITKILPLDKYHGKGISKLGDKIKLKVRKKK